MCIACRHLQEAVNMRDAFRCTAFPKGIPAEIIEEYADHRLPFVGDGGIRFEAKSAVGVEYVEELYGPVERAEVAS